MSDYRKEALEIKSNAQWTIWKFLPIIIMIFVILFGLKSLGLIGSTMVENQVFKNSFQYKEGMAQRAGILEANLIELDILIRSRPENVQDLINQKTILKAQLRAITINN